MGKKTVLKIPVKSFYLSLDPIVPIRERKKKINKIFDYERTTLFHEINPELGIKSCVKL